MQEVKVKLYTSTPMMQNSGTLPNEPGNADRKKENVVSERETKTKT